MEFLSLTDKEQQQDTDDCPAMIAMSHMLEARKI